MNTSELIFVGIDVSKDALEVALDDQSKTQCVTNTDADIAALVKKLTPRSAQFGVINCSEP